MPIPPLVIPPHLLGGPAAIHAVRAAATSSSAAAGASSILAYALAGRLWNRTPEWVRDDATWKALSGGGGDGSGGNGREGDVFRDEMASLAAVIGKLEGLVATGYDKLGSRRRVGRRRRIVQRTIGRARRADEDGTTDRCPSRTSPTEIEEDDDHAAPISALEWHAALLAYWQLCNQIRERYPSYRDRMYLCGPLRCDATGGAHVAKRVRDDLQQSLTGESIEDEAPVQEESNVPADGNGSEREYVSDGCTPRDDDANQMTNIAPCQIKKLQIMLSYAVWAYEPNEEQLRSLLLNGSKEGVKQSDCDTSTATPGGYQLIVHRTTSYINDGETNDATNDTNGKRTKNNKKKRKPPGRVGYFVAVSHENKSLLIGIKGTSTLEELLTDCCGRAVRVDLDNDPHCLVRKDCCDAVEDVEHHEQDGYGVLDEPRDEVASVPMDFENATQLDATDSDGLSPEILDGVESEQGRRKEANFHEINTTQSTPKSLQKSERGAIDTIRVLSEGTVEVELGDSHLAQPSSKALAEDEEQPPAASETKNSMAGKIPSSENVLLLPSFPTKSMPQLTATFNEQEQKDATPEICHSPTEEFMESHCIEMEANMSHKVRGAHEGILHCAQQLLFELSPLIEEYAVSKGYDVVCTGHSLGAGTAILLAVLIRGTYLVLAEPDGEAAESSDEPRSRQRVQAFAFAPPPLLDRASSLACRHYVTSIVNNSDIIPRSSLTNLDVLLTMLWAVRCRLVELGMNPGVNAPKRKDDIPNSNIVASSVALFRKLLQGTGGELLLDPHGELDMVMEEAIAEASLGDGEDGEIYWNQEFGHHLFVPGQLLLIHEPWSAMNGVDEACEPPAENSPVDTNAGCQRSQDSTSGGQVGYVATTSKWTNGTDRMLKTFEIGAGSGMFTDHLTTSYERGLETIQRSVYKCKGAEKA